MSSLYGDVYGLRVRVFDGCDIELAGKNRVRDVNAGVVFEATQRVGGLRAARGAGDEAMAELLALNGLRTLCDLVCVLLSETADRWCFRCSCSTPSTAGATSTLKHRAMARAALMRHIAVSNGIAKPMSR